MTLAAGPFLMTLDSSVMNVSIATVANDVGTTVTGIQTAITFEDLASEAQVELSSGIPFVSDVDLKAGLDRAGVSGETADTLVDQYATARLDVLRASLAVLAVRALIALLFTRRIPSSQPGSPDPDKPPMRTHGVPGADGVLT